MVAAIFLVTSALPVIADSNTIATPNSRVDVASAADKPSDFWQAVNAGSLPLVKQYARKSDFNARDRLDQTALMIAAGHGYGDVVAYLLDQGADINLTGPRNWTPLIAAAFNNHAAVVRQLLAAKADASIKSSDGFDAVFYAIEYAHSDVLDALIAGGADLQSRLPRAIASGHTALMHASQRNALVPAQRLLDSGVAIDATDTRGQTALFYAAQSDSLAMLDLLKRARANINAVDKNNNTLLHVVAERGNVSSAQWLIDNGVAVNSANRNGDTALTLAAFAGNTDITQLLLKHAGGAEKSAAWFAAIRGGALPTVTALADAHVDLNARNTFGETALMLAAQLRHAHIVGYLIEHKADVNAADPHGNNALMLAVTRQPIHTGVVQRLLAAGCDASRQNDKGQNARDLLAASADNTLRELAVNLYGAD